MEFWKQLYLSALGPLQLDIHFDLHYTLGEITDLIIAHRYRTYLEQRDRIQVALLIISPHVKNVPNLDDITGVWCDGRVLTPKDKYYVDKQKALDYKKNMEVMKDSKEESK